MLNARKLDFFHGEIIASHVNMKNISFPSHFIASLLFKSYFSCVWMMNFPCCTWKAICRQYFHNKYPYHPWNCTYCIFRNKEYNFCGQTWKETAKKPYGPAQRHHNSKGGDKGQCLPPLQLYQALKHTDEETKVSALCSTFTENERKQIEQCHYMRNDNCSSFN